MTVEEIFNKLASHMVEGIMYHEEMAKIYDFAGLWGFAKCQDYHYMEESQGYRRLSHYYATHYFKLLQLEEIIRPKLLPDNWYKYTTQSMDASTKRSTVKDLMNKWIEWEQSTKKLYQEMRLELDKLGELDAARKLNNYIEDVSTELHNVQKLTLKLESIGYDMITIEEISDHLHKKYKKKLGW